MRALIDRANDERKDHDSEERPIVCRVPTSDEQRAFTEEFPEYATVSAPSPSGRVRVIYGDRKRRPVGGCGRVG